MALTSLSNASYIPVLGLRPAEMQALDELPERDKDQLLPLIQLGPWVGAHNFASSLAKLEESFGNRPVFVTLCDREQSIGDRSVHREIAALRSPDRGYDEWCLFLEQQPNFIPAIQIESITNLAAQISRLYSLGRGLIIPFEQRSFAGIDSISRAVSAQTNGGANVCFFLDFGRADKDLIFSQAKAKAAIAGILENAPNSRVSISASSFPESFTAVTKQEIFERSLHMLLKADFGTKLIYSDRGSARAERQTGGGGTPAPRIDYALDQEWKFFRSDDSTDRYAAYAEQAKAAIDDPNWDKNLRVWGTQMIERTALGDRSAIVSPKRSTAARINIHLHRQLHYGRPSDLYETDDDWLD
ncbi:beta family protein [Acidisoma silvae]|uniref:Beta family protein n=1 Tax=Acidisoma silvae TaxID=2802396 RepID=A0A963YWJ3_9PROT|nr:beta family protein [Acidisoma silvae]MCB8877662.1 beta family protein [Acidisoma silvae]